MFVADHYCNSLLGELYDHILPFLAQEATSVAACACVEDIIMDMTFATAKRVDPLMDFLASNEVLQIYENARRGRAAHFDSQRNG